MDINIEFGTNPEPLGEIMGRHGSDKGNQNNTAEHNYTNLYHVLFNPVRNNLLRVFELGLGTNNTSIPSNMGPHGKPGASLRGWAEFFPNASVFGADIDRNILFSENRIKTFFCDQTNPQSIKDMWNEPELSENFDIIIEDGLHKFEANVCFFENSIHKLNIGGIYVIEDIANFNLGNFAQRIQTWSSPSLQFRMVSLFHPYNSSNNNVLLVQRIA